MPPCSHVTLAWCLECAKAVHLSLQLREAKENKNLAEVLVSPDLKSRMLHFTPFLLPQLLCWLFSSTSFYAISFFNPFCALLYPSPESQYQLSDSENL